MKRIGTVMISSWCLLAGATACSDRGERPGAVSDDVHRDTGTSVLREDVERDARDVRQEAGRAGESVEKGTERAWDEAKSKASETKKDLQHSMERK